MPGTLCIVFIWIAMYLMVPVWDLLPQICGKGIGIINREYYRFFTAGLVHTNFLHLLMNCSTILWVGYLYEQRLGTVRFLAAGMVCAVFAQFVFLCIFPSTEVSIGGSCYPFALCGLGLMLAFLVPSFPKIKLGTWSGNWIAIYLIGSNIPLLPFMDVTAGIIHGIAFILGILAALMCVGFKFVKI